MESRANREEISDYYGTFCEEEKGLKLNLRHYSVFRHLVKSGLKKNHRVLEIGCGFGTITSLISKYLNRGALVATDISEERIASCRKTFANRKNTTFVLTDMTDFVTDERFDFIVLPDVLEHIPIENHQNLFTLMNSVLKPEGVVFIHLPHPTAIAYLRKTKPEALQIIDQSVNSDELLKHAYSAGLRLEVLKSYTLAQYPSDYQTIVLRKDHQYQGMSSIGNWNIRWKKLGARLFYLRKML